MDQNSTEAELLRLNRQLLDAIDSGDWDIYEDLCEANLTAYEPEAVGYLVQGLEFHRYYFDLEKEGRQQSTISSPHIRVLGDVAIVTYIRLTQSLNREGAPQTIAAEETRIWQRQNGDWRHVHFHRSKN